MDALRVEHLSKSFGGLQVLKDVSFSIKAGEKVAIIGPNGAGKTTLLHIVGGQLKPTAGKVYLFDQDITSFAPNQRLRCGVARSFQVNNLFFKLTVLDNILLAAYGAERFHFQMLRTLNSQKHLFAKARKVLEPMGLWEKRFAPIRSLSYGEQRQMEIACSLVSEPRLLLLDEPSAGLPIADAIALGKTIRDLQGDITMIFAAHDMDLVFKLADRIMVLYFGQIIADGTPEEIRADPKVRKIYLGSEESAGNVGGK